MRKVSINRPGLFHQAVILAFGVAFLRQEVARGESPPDAVASADYDRDVRPILAASCYECHGPARQEGGLRLDSKKRALAGGDSGPAILAGNSAESLLMQRISGIEEAGDRMPPGDEREPLSDQKIAAIRVWIDQGADWPDEDSASALDAQTHWSFQSLTAPTPPAVLNSAWVRNPIDAFILARLEQEGVAPSPEADRATMLRRVYLDLIGLPPRPEELAAFLADGDVNAYDRVVDELLESPQYGERWGRVWLDAARYADSDGYEKDTARPFAWRYRDWVIDALNRDLPFDVFTVQQLAGDLLRPGDREFDVLAVRGTGFHRNTLLNKEGGADPEEDRVKRTVDRTNTTGAVWLGMTVGCANCHTHKYDPLTQREYFGLYAFFDNIREVDLPVGVEAAGPWTPDTTPREVLPDDERGAPDDGESRGMSDRRAIANASARAQDGADDSPRDEDLFAAITEGAERRVTRVHLRGDFLSPGPEVAPHTPECLPRLAPRGVAADRLDLARWIVAEADCLSARVLANRMWQWHFGRGLVATGDDFGTQGEPPSHASLLDWLACDIRDGGWRLKRIHRLIVTSAAYRQASASRPELAARDPYNAWGARQNRLRFEAETVRDAALAASGLLCRKIGGPSVRPPQPLGVSNVTYNNFANWKESLGDDRYRRGLYVWFQRTSPYPSLVAFDAPDASLACTRRESSNTPLQALTLLNDEVFVECARSLGRRLVEDVLPSQPGAADQETETRRIGRAFEICLSRTPTSAEIELLLSLHQDARRRLIADSESALMLVDPRLLAGKTLSPDEAADAAAWTLVARALLNTDEFITRK